MKVTVDEDDFLIQSFMALTLPQIRAELREIGIPISGTKEAIRERIVESLDNGDLKRKQLILAIDNHAPWSRQHVYLLKGPTQIPSAFKSLKSLTQHLEENGLGKLLNKHIPLVLPKKLTLSSIEYTNSTLRIIAIKRRDYALRDPELDEEAETFDGDPVELRAFVHHVARGLTIFEWDTVANVAMLQITELPSGVTYENVRDEFQDLVSTWIDISRLTDVNIHVAIARLHELEETGKGEARSHGIEYRTIQGRRLSGHSSTKNESVLGETVIDDALQGVRAVGVGRTGNFYWLSRTDNPAHKNPLDSECHVVLIGHRNRINFKANNSSEIVRHVLSRIRSYC